MKLEWHVLSHRPASAAAKTGTAIDPNRRAALTTGVLLIAATAASLFGTAIEQPVLTGTDYLARTAENLNRVSLGGLLEFIAAGTSAAIAISLYPVLKGWNAHLALGAVAFRVIEAVMYTVGAVSMLSLLKVAPLISNAAAADRAWYQAIGDTLLAAREEAILAGVFAFCVGALMYYHVFFQSRLIPRWLSGWGFLAALLMLVACLSALFSRNPVTSYTILILPIAVQEMVLAVWLIARGFSPAALEVPTIARASAA